MKIINISEGIGSLMAKILISEISVALILLIISLVYGS